MKPVQPMIRKGRTVRCGHPGCYRPAVRIVSYERPQHRDFHGQTHDCCAVHSRPGPAERAEREDPAD